MNFAFAPTTLTTGCRPIVFVTPPPHPASNARMMLLSDSVGGADERRNGFSNSLPVNVVVPSAMIPPSEALATWLGTAALVPHPVRPRLTVPLRRHLLRLRPEL